MVSLTVFYFLRPPFGECLCPSLMVMVNLNISYRCLFSLIQCDSVFDSAWFSMIERDSVWFSLQRDLVWFSAWFFFDVLWWELEWSETPHCRPPSTATLTTAPPAASPAGPSSGGLWRNPNRRFSTARRASVRWTWSPGRNVPTAGSHIWFMDSLVSAPAPAPALTNQPAYHHTFRQLS